MDSKKNSERLFLSRKNRPNLIVSSNANYLSFCCKTASFRDYKANVAE